MFQCQLTTVLVQCNGSAVEDCTGECNGSGVLDCLIAVVLQCLMNVSVCDGSGIAEGACEH